MGSALSSIVAEAERLGGLQGKLMLAGITRMTTGQANSVADTPELIATFTSALETLKRTVKAQGGDAKELKPGATAEQLRRHVTGFVDLMTQRSLVLGDVLETARRVDELATETLNVARVSVWTLKPDGSSITCVDLYEREVKKHSSGTELFAKDFGPYFVALGTQRTIAAHQAQTDPNTACFAASYLKPLGITSMLDVPIWVAGKMVGVVCHEHIGPSRVWNADEESFAYLMAGFISLAMERAQLGVSAGRR